MFSADLNKIHYTKIGAIVIIIMATLVAPVWFIYQFAPKIFNSFEVLKLILLSLGLGMPLTYLNGWILYLITKPENSDTEDQYVASFGGGAAFTILVFYSPMLITYFHYVSLYQAKIISTITEIIIIMLFLIAKKSKRPTLPKKSPSSSQSDIESG